MKNDPLQIYNLLKEIYFWLDNGDRRLMECYRLTIPRFYVLKHIADSPGLSMTQLSKLMLSDKSNITRLIRGLELEGLVQRQPAEDDKRKMCLFLSRKGQDILAEVIGAHDSLIKERFSNLEMDETFLQHLGEIRKNLADKLEQSQQ